uniref:Uncharacterized protein n=1 Tax=Acrobeloides nanus TaxID=290746 RepID=A0A914CGU1_9BILA
MILDFGVWKHPRPAKTKAIKSILIFCILYLIDIHLIYYVSGFWAYPILGQLAFPFRMLFIVFCTAVIFGAFLIGDVYNSYLLDSTGKQKKAKKQRRD